MISRLRRVEDMFARERGGGLDKRTRPAAAADGRSRGNWKPRHHLPIALASLVLAFISGSSGATVAMAGAVPGAPGNVAGATGNCFALVSWSAPSAGSTPVSSYTVVPLQYGSPTPNANTVVVSPTATATQVSATPGYYTFKVFATNAAGSGPASVSSLVTVYGRCYY